MTVASYIGFLGLDLLFEDICSKLHLIRMIHARQFIKAPLCILINRPRLAYLLLLVIMHLRLTQPSTNKESLLMTVS